MENNRLIKLRWGLVGLVFALGGWLGLVSLQVRAMAPNTFTWQIDVIDSIGDVGYTPSLALEPGTDDPHISYYDNTLKDLKLAFPVSSGGDCGPSNHWSCNSLAYQNTTDFGLFSSLAFNSLGQWGIAYGNSALGVNEFRGIPSVVGQELFFEPIEEPALAISLMNNLRYGENDVSHVSYGLIDINQTKAFVKHAKYVGQFGNCGYGMWQCETIIETSMTGWSLYNSLSMLGNLPFIFYRDINQHLSMTVNNFSGNCGPANDWDCSEIDATTTVNGLISSYLSPAGDYLGVAYIGNDTLRYAYTVPEGQGNCGSGFWYYQCLTIDSVGLAPNNQWMATSLGFYNGQPIIAYTDTNDWAGAVLKVAYPQANGNCGPLNENQQYTWRCEIVDGGEGRNSLGYYPSLQVDSEGRIHIAYYDLTAGNLKYAFSDTPINPTPTATPPPGTLSPRVYLPMLVR